MITLLIFLLVLSVLVFVHESGHFIVAKRAGLRVDEFGFGFPPRLFGIQRGNTIYSINALPFGGFVKIKGESGEDASDQDSFASRGAGVRICVVAAGVIMNALLAVVIIAVSYTIGFTQVVEGNASKYARVTEQRMEILSVLPGGPAAQVGIAPGDRLISGNGRAFNSAEEFKMFVAEYLGKPVHLALLRNGESREIAVTPKILDQTKKSGIGIAIAAVGKVQYPLWLAVPKAFEITGALFKTIAVAVGGIIRDGFSGKPVSADLAGPVGIAVLTGQAAKQGFAALAQFVAILSINLAFLNIIPFPALDGGRILFIVIEKIIRRRIPQRVEGWMHGIGFALLILLVLAVTARDVGRYGGVVVEAVKNFAR